VVAQLGLTSDVEAVLRDPLLLPAVLLADSMGWPSSYSDLMAMPYDLYILALAVKAARVEDRPPH
jgi:hypothetical protein